MRYLEYSGIQVSREDLDDFQKVFPSSRAAIVLNRLIDKLAETHRENLASLGSSVEQVRQAQGALDALGRLLEAGEYLAGVQVDWEGANESGDDGSDLDSMGEDISYG